MTIEIFSADERTLLEAWFHSAPINGHLDTLLRAAGFDHDCEPYTRLDAWVGAFAVAEIQGQLPNCGICNGCDNCRIFCPEVAVSVRGSDRRIELDYCKGCGICVTECPRRAMAMEQEAS